MINILVTGGNGQLATCIKDIESNYSNLNIIYTDSDILDITDLKAVQNFFNNKTIHYCINCAAYTAVDKAETEQQVAKEINTLGPSNLARICKDNKTTLIQISTDFVFKGDKSIAYIETDTTIPTGIYALTKLEGEQEVARYLNQHFIIRTSWLYSENGNNFMKTMIKLSHDRNELNVVADQIGTPTYATDLAETILKIITTNHQEYGIYHYSNEGVASWYDFAKAIFEEARINIKVLPIKTKEYPTPAKRPHFSVLDKSKIKTSLNIEIPYWRDSLKKALSNYNG
ncbi:dTDP-4-dehydrorhamnose reductase [Oceanihabitans sediminis]|uniref:dTDP-4-dehydrorhamnose reductase n=1 Tax=Oceanihabitans sediminis TaxID=1812012 RepID=A0A368P7Q8_9FLAO|nr:dTDP-4-dehydrorhamnose reductase [Oceanihabitans sediminis]RBP34677.1 dTDP-4-dehydrorhamnose reductase [Oceanihabitans sediminis]RCU58330.1 dTDP-4-dehydrorhamnose reductase [Oceanihabitans sediminis]